MGQAVQESAGEPLGVEDLYQLIGLRSFSIISLKAFCHRYNLGPLSVLAVGGRRQPNSWIEPSVVRLR